MTQGTTDDVASRCNSGVHINPTQQMVASSTGALLTSLLVTPLDVVKTRLQMQSKPLARGQHFYYCNGLMDHVCTCMNGNSQQWYKKPGHFSGTLDAVVKIGRYEGIPALWSGLPPTLVMAVPATVVYFTLYEQLKASINYRQYNGADWWKPMVAGVTARTIAVSFISPLELVRTKMQSEQLSYADMGRAIRNSIRQDGVRSLWRGLVPTLLRDVPFSALYWYCYERMKYHALCLRGSQELTFIESFSSGAAAGSFAAIITLPFDVIKTHRQIEVGVLKNGVEMSSTWRLIGRLYADRGIQALFTGLVPRVVKVAPACAIMISTYEYFKSFFLTYNHGDAKSLAN